jgi:hypothetical protein
VYCITDCHIEVYVLLSVLLRGEGVGLITPVIDLLVLIYDLDVLCSKSSADGSQHTCTLFHGLALS